MRHGAGVRGGSSLQYSRGAARMEDGGAAKVGGGGKGVGKRTRKREAAGGMGGGGGGGGKGRGGGVRGGSSLQYARGAAGMEDGGEAKVGGWGKGVGKRTRKREAAGAMAGAGWCAERSAAAQRESSVEAGGRHEKNQ